MNRRIFLEGAAATALLATAARGSSADAADFGFSPHATGLENTRALQRAVDRTGTIIVSQPGTYQIAGTVYIGGNTSLIFENNVFLRKVAEQGTFTHVLLNKGALTRTYDEHIAVSGLQLIVNGVDVRNWQVYGLHGQIAFFYVRDLRIERFRCLDGGPLQFVIHVCTFEDLTIDDIHIQGLKDGVHLGRGKRFAIRNGVFETGDDAIALNGHDYAVGNPELGWIEDGVVENMHDLPNPKRQIGYFCRIVAGAWSDWRPGMEVRQSDTVVSGGRLYRVQANPDGTVYQSVTRPVHESGAVVLDGINWGVVQNDVTYTAGVRNVVFRDVILEKVRIAFSVHFGSDKYSRSYYPGATVPRQEKLVFDNVRILHDSPTDFLQVRTPVDVLSIASCSLRDNGITFESNTAIGDYGKTRIGMTGCIFGKRGALDLVVNKIPRKLISLKTEGSVELSDDFSARVMPGEGSIVVDSDLTGLRK